jgi:hypothetical protein
MSAPTDIETMKAFGEPTGEYIIELKDDASMEIVLAKLDPAEAQKAIHKFTTKTHGFAGFSGMYSVGIHTNPLTDHHGKKKVHSIRRPLGF